MAETIRQFARAAVFDWSGAAVERPGGIRLGIAAPGEAPRLVRPGHRWSRQEALGWIEDQAGEDMLIGLDIGTSLPFVDAGAFFPGFLESPAGARELWALVEQLSATDPHLSASSFVGHPELRRYFRHTGQLGDRYGPRRAGRVRVTEAQSALQRIARPVSNLNLVGAAQVGKASLTGMRLLHRLSGRVPVWPFDPVPASGALIVEIYTSIAAVAAGRPLGRAKLRDAATLDRALAVLHLPPSGLAGALDDHSSDALLTAAWLLQASARAPLWRPAALTPALAATEGWTFGVG